MVKKMKEEQHIQKNTTEGHELQKILKRPRKARRTKEQRRKDKQRASEEIIKYKSRTRKERSKDKVYRE